MRNVNNLKKISRALLLEIGEDPDRIGLKDTPTRMAKMWIDIFKGYDKEQIPEVTVFPNGQDGICYDQIITDTGTFNSWCLTGDTQISIPGGNECIKNLVGKEIFVYSYDEKKKQFTIKKASNIRKTQSTVQTYKVILDDGSIIKATDNHKFLLSNGSWKQLKDLKVQDSLMYLTRGGFCGEIYINKYAKKSHTNGIRESRFVWECFNNQFDLNWLGYCIHHKDGNHFNNNPLNLERMSIGAHLALHESLRTSEQKTQRGKTANKALQELKTSNPKQYEENIEKRKEGLKDFYQTDKGIKLRKEKAIKLEQEWKTGQKINHKVLFIQSGKKEDVYNMEVEGTHNFVANNVVVHNCEHHMALFQGTYYFGYIPNKLIVGLSKIARVVDYFSARLQVQERLGENIISYIDAKLKPQGMILILKAKHTCKTVRGVKKDGNMTTSILTGIFKEDISARNEFLSLINL